MQFQFGDQVIGVTHRDSAALLDAVQDRLRAGQGFALATINLDHLVKLHHAPTFRQAYAAQDMVVADGNPIVWLSRLACRSVALVPGSDLVIPMAQAAAQAGRPLMLVGSSAAALAGAAACLSAKVPGLTLGPCIAPPQGFDPAGADARAILDQIAQAGPGL
ncbi:MAG: WecB/TagA/CpsF family glycosyltransferase, partial [Paracoccaceae bacterium]|nr:WecB/TagA/CpsF family glycosyltransferase [Paracoccaceae bacterium]